MIDLQAHPEVYCKYMDKNQVGYPMIHKWAKYNAQHVYIVGPWNRWATKAAVRGYDIDQQKRKQWKEKWTNAADIKIPYIYYLCVPNNLLCINIT